MYVIFYIESTVMVGSDGHSWSARTYKNAWQAKKYCENLNRKAGQVLYSWLSADEYQNRVVHMVERINLRSGQKYLEPSNTPDYLSPSCERYWTM